MISNYDCNGCSLCVSQNRFYTTQFVLSGYKICPDTSLMQFAFVTVYLFMFKINTFKISEWQYFRSTVSVQTRAEKLVCYLVILILCSC